MRYAVGLVTILFSVIGRGGGGEKSSFRQPPRDRDPGVTSATGAKPPSSKTSKSLANSRGSKNRGGQMAETSQTMGVIAMNAVQKKLVRPDIPSCALATTSCQVSKPGELQQLGTRIFFDSGSQCSFITRELAESLNLETFSEVRLGIDAFQSETKEDNFPVVVVSVKLGSKGVQLKLLVVDDLPITISTPGIVAATNELKLAGFELADKHLDSDIVENIGIILGALHLHVFVKGHRKFREFDLIHTTGGVMLQGKIPNTYQGTRENVHSVVVLRVGAQILPREREELVVDELEPVHKLWELDGIGIKEDDINSEECTVMENFLLTVRYDQGQHWVRLPWKFLHSHLPHNFDRALGQFRSLVGQLKRDPVKFKHYDKVIQDQVKMGLVEKVEENRPKLVDCHYLPPS